MRLEVALRLVGRRIETLVFTRSTLGCSMMTVEAQRRSHYQRADLVYCQARLLAWVRWEG